jgi:iodotyrosine deiodinase
MKPHEHIALAFPRIPPQEQLRASREFPSKMAARRSVRFIASDPVPLELIENAIRCASLAPSGANQQPWKFVVVKDPEIKRRIRERAEAEERESYDHRMPAEWLEALAPLGTDWHKEFLETAPYLIVVFRIDVGLTQTDQALLCPRIGRHRHRISPRCPPLERACNSHSYTESDGLPFPHPSKTAE